MTHPRKIAQGCSLKRANVTGFKRLLLLTMPYMLSSLFPRFARWLTRSGTAAIEFLNVLGLIGFGALMILHEKGILVTNAFLYFDSYPKLYPWLVMIAVGMVQAYLMIKVTSKSNQLGGIILGGSSIIWFIIAGTFGYNYPPVSTALPLYLGVGIITGSGGYALLNAGKEQEVLEETRSR